MGVELQVLLFKKKMLFPSHELQKTSYSILAQEATVRFGTHTLSAGDPRVADVYILLVRSPTLKLYNSAVYVSALALVTTTYGYSMFTLAQPLVAGDDVTHDT